jgi:hypothetical protein
MPGSTGETTAVDKILNHALKVLSLFRQGEIVLFISLWLVYGLLINSDNLQAFNLQQIGVEAIGERGHFYLEGSTTPQLQPRGDTFRYRGHVYAAKQPGQFMVGAVIYRVLHYFGLNYRSNYLLCSALITFLTTSLATAIAAVFVFRFAKQLTKGQSTVWPTLAALTFGLATTALPYSGIAHHDALASDYLVIACYFLFRLSRERLPLGGEIARAGCAGFLLGLTVTTSMLPALMAVVTVVWFISFRRWTLSLVLLLGSVVGLMPLFIYDAVSFGKPFLLPNWAGHFSDTYFHISWHNLIDKVRFYARFTTQYAPTFWLGLIGLFCLPRKYRREAILFFSLIAVLAAYILNIDTVGTCMYGPRYLLPAMPFASVGVIGLSYLRIRWLYWAASAAVVAVGLFSAFVNVVGAMQGAMYCDLSRFALWPYLSAITTGRGRSFPLLPCLIGPMLLLCLFVVIGLGLRCVQVRHRRAESTTG